MGTGTQNVVGGPLDGDFDVKIRLRRRLCVPAVLLGVELPYSPWSGQSREVAGSGLLIVNAR